MPPTLCSAKTEEQNKTATPDSTNSLSTPSPSNESSSPSPQSTPPVPKPSREFFPVLNGLRVVLTFWVVAFHCAWHFAMFLPEDIFIPQFHALPEIITSGLNGVDWFFVLTGFLLAQPIFAGQRTGGWFSFVWMRITRLYPMYIVAISLFCLGMSQLATLPYLDWEQHICHVLRPLVDSGLKERGLPLSQGVPNNCHISWVNLLFLNNLAPFGGCMGWTWSLCIQVHFILIFPLVLRWFGTSTKFIKFCAVSTVVWMISRYLILTLLVQNYPIDPPPLYIYKESFIEQFFVLFNVWYSSTFQRIGCIFTGAVLAWVQVNKPTCITNLHKNTFAIWSITFFAFLSFYLGIEIHFQQTWRAFLFSVGGLGHVVAIAIVVYMLINNLGPLSIFTPILTSNIMKHLAYPSYGVYLMHSFLIVWVYRGPLFKPHEHLGLDNLGCAFVVVITLSYVLAYLSTRFVEEPIKVFLRDYVDPAPKVEKVD